MMLNVSELSRRVKLDDVVHLYPDKYVLLGHVENDTENQIDSGIPIAIGDRGERDVMWELFWTCLKQKNHGEVYLDYYGDIGVETVGVYV